MKTSTRPMSSAFSLLMSAVLLLAPLTPVLRANDAPASARKRFLPVVPANAAPIGTLESFGKTLIDGRRAQGRELLWGGELIQAPAEMSVRIQLEGAGQVTLARGSAARFATAQPRFEGNVLIAALERGELKVSLLAEANAYVEAGEQAFLSSAGARFRLARRADEVETETSAGELWPWQTPRKDELSFNLGSINRTNNFVPVSRNPSVVKRKARSETTLTFQGSRKPAATAPAGTPRKGQTALVPSGTQSVISLQPAAFRLVQSSEAALLESDQTNAPPPSQGWRPAVAQGVIIEVDAQLGCLVAAGGTCSPRVQAETNAQGVVSVTFRATNTRQSGKLTLTAEETPATERYTRQWRLEVGPVFLTKPVKLMIGAAAVGLGLFFVFKGGNEPLTPVPPPVIIK